MRIGNDRTVAREMLGNRGHPGAAQSAREFGCQLCDDLRLGVKGTVADDLAYTPVQIHAGREAQVDST